MRNRLTFTNVIGVLLENKKKTYPQHQLVRNLFSAYLDDTLTSSDLIVDDNIQYSRWCNGTRPIPMDIIKAYEDDEWDTMEDDFHDKIIPNLINPSNAHLQMQELLKDSIPVIGQHTAEMDEEALFHSHYDILKRLHSDSLIILDNFNVLLLFVTLPTPNYPKILQIKRRYSITHSDEYYVRLFYPVPFVIISKSLSTKEAGTSPTKVWFPASLSHHRLTYRLQHYDNHIYRRLQSYYSNFL